MSNIWQLEVRRGWVSGLVLAVILVAATVGLVAIAVITPLSIWIFLLGLGACITLGLTVRVLYQLWGLINASYELDRNALVIDWGPIKYQIPMSSIRQVVPGTQLEHLRIRPSLRWPGYFVALGQGTFQDAEDTETPVPILFFATTGIEKQIIIRTDNVAYAISPSNPEDFLVALRDRLEMGPTQEVEERISRPRFLSWEIWRDRWGLALLLGSSGLLILLTGFLCWRYPHLPPEITLRFTSDGYPLLTANADHIFYFALLGAGFLIIDGGIGLLLYHRERPLSYFLWSGLLALMGGLWAAVISILHAQ